MAEINIDAKNAIFGRMATFAAKQALLGNTINIFNCEGAVISGNPVATRARYYYLIYKTGQPNKGPFYSKMPDRFVKRMLRGMLPHKQQRGIDAYKRIMCYLGIPEEFKNKKLIKIKDADASKLPKLKSITIQSLLKSLGGSYESHT